MDFATAPKRRPTEAILPMINVVFLLLIFFLMTAQIAPRAPFAVTPPDAPAEGAPQGEGVLFAGSDGALFYNGLQGDALWAELSARTSDTPLILRADTALDGPGFAALLTRLGAMGITSVELVVGAP